MAEHRRSDGSASLKPPDACVTRSEHPLSPGVHSLPSLNRRPSALAVAHSPSLSPPSGLPNISPGYFDSAPASAVGAPAASSSTAIKRVGGTNVDLMGVPSPQRNTRPSIATTSSITHVESNGAPVAETSRTTGSPAKARAAFDSLSGAELAVVETRFDLMSDEELAAYLEDFSLPRLLDSLDRQAGPSSPKPILAKHRVDEPPSPLFPPSPPMGSTVPHRPEHPLRVLSKALRELQEVVDRLEEENRSLRLQLDKRKTKRQADVTSIHEGLNEALSTTLNDAPMLPDPPSVPRPSSPAPSVAKSFQSVRSTRTRPKSPSESFKTPLSPSGDTPNGQPAPSGSGTPGGTPGRDKHRASWTSGLWVWGSGGGPKKVARPRKGSLRSMKSGKSGKQIEEVPEDAIADDEDEHAWRKGDGGSPPGFKAIFLATRIITPDPGSILHLSSIPPNSLIAYLAHALVSNARDEGITAQDAPGRRRSSREARSRATSVSSQLVPSSSSQGSSTPSKGYGDSALAATASIGRTLLSSVSSATIRAKPSEDHRPSLLSRVSSNRPFPTTAISAPADPLVNGTTGLDDAPPPSVELSSIVPDESRPPTVLLSRQNLGSFFQSSKAVPTLRTATRFNAKEPPLTDRYGFIYDIQHASMLKDANVARAVAPASLNGTMPINKDTGEGWIERQRKAHDLKRVESSTDPDQIVSPPPSALLRQSFDSTASGTSSRASIRSVETSGSHTPPSSRPSSQAPDQSHRHRSSTLVNLNPPPAKPSIAKETLTVSSRGVSSLRPEVSSPSSLSAALVDASLVIPDEGASRVTVSSLLEQLTEIHDQQQKERMAEWDAFLKKRRGKQAETGRGDETKWGTGLIGISQMGLGKSGAEEWKAFARLARRGIPLAYRADVWAECSGAKDAMIPGEYTEILAVHKDDTSPFLGEIEKDVSRTFPGNVFFGGDGPGVAKLRRVLVAYAWHNPNVGYCQGMNMLAATLLLTHTDEEQAYWVLQSLIDRLLPKDFFSPSLLASRADQAVLADLVKQYTPKIHTQLEDLGVDLASVTFGWFLSLFTDCLPVETLFRVWDIFFVEGHDTLFRVAIAILKLAEPDLITCDTVSDLFAFVGSMTSRLWAADKLIALQHSYKSLIRHSDIASKFERHLHELSTLDD